MALKYWTGAADAGSSAGNWTVDGNWSPNGQPNGDDVVFTDSAVTGAKSLAQDEADFAQASITVAKDYTGTLGEDAINTLVVDATAIYYYGGTGAWLESTPNTVVCRTADMANGLRIDGEALNVYVRKGRADLRPRSLYVGHVDNLYGDVNVIVRGELRSLYQCGGLVTVVGADAGGALSVEVAQGHLRWNDCSNDPGAVYVMGGSVEYNCTAQLTEAAYVMAGSLRMPAESLPSSGGVHVFDKGRLAVTPGIAGGSVVNYGGGVSTPGTIITVTQHSHTPGQHGAFPGAR